MVPARNYRRRGAVAQESLKRRWCFGNYRQHGLSQPSNWLDCLDSKRLTVGRTARLAEVGIPTMRFYERAGLLPKAARTAANYRLYSNEAVSRIRFIRRAQQLGFTLKDIKELLGLHVSGRTSCSEVLLSCRDRRARIQGRFPFLRLCVPRISADRMS